MQRILVNFLPSFRDNLSGNNDISWSSPAVLPVQVVLLVGMGVRLVWSSLSMNPVVCCCLGFIFFYISCGLVPFVSFRELGSLRFYSCCNEIFC